MSAAPQLETSTPETYQRFTPKINSNDYEPANFWRRFYAFFLDIFFTGILSAIFEKTIMVMTNDPVVVNLGSLFIYPLFVLLIYHCFFTIKFGGSPGKRLMKLRVVQSKTDLPVNFHQMVLREFIGKIASVIILGVGYLMSLWTENNMTLHDYIGRTRVVKDPKK